MILFSLTCCEYSAAPQGCTDESYSVTSPPTAVRLFRRRVLTCLYKQRTSVRTEMIQ